MTTTQPPAVRAYLDELRTLLAGSPDRELVVDGVVRHIEDALAGGPTDPARVQQVLDELGDPAVIAADAAPAPVRPAPFLARRSGAVLTILLLTLGGLVVPVAGWIVGLGLLWFSKGWRLVDKLVGTFTIPVVLAAVLGIGSLIQSAVPPAAGCAGDGFCAPTLAGSFFPSHLLLLLLFPVLDVAVAVYLWFRFRERR